MIVKKKMQQVKKYIYLGVIITNDGRDEEKIKARLGKFEILESTCGFSTAMLFTYGRCGENY